MAPLDFFLGVLACALVLQAFDLVNAWAERAGRIAAARRRGQEEGR